MNPPKTHSKNRNNLRISEIKNPRELQQHMLRWKESDMPPKEFKFYCDQIPHLQTNQSTQINYLNMFRILKKQNLEELNFSTIASFCEALSKILPYVSLEHYIMSAIEKKVE